MKKLRNNLHLVETVDDLLHADRLMKKHLMPTVKINSLEELSPELIRFWSWFFNLNHNEKIFIVGLNNWKNCTVRIVVGEENIT